MLRTEATPYNEMVMNRSLNKIIYDDEMGGSEKRKISFLPMRR